MHALETYDLADADSFVVNMRRDPGGEALVASVELRSFEVRNRYSFRQARSLHDTFDDRFADLLLGVLRRLKSGERIISVPEFEFAVGDLIIGGLRVLVSTAENGAESIMLRFRQYIGSIKLAFKFDDSMAMESVTLRERIAVDVLQDILTPLFDLMALDTPGMEEILERHSPAIRKRLAAISARKEEITFFSTLLQRYVKGCKQDAMKEATADDPSGRIAAEVSRTVTQESLKA